MSYELSQQWYDRAAGIPGRSNTRSKAPGRFFDVGQGPLYAAGGRGAMVRCVDGLDYIDMLCALGAVGLGYGVIAEDKQLMSVCSLPGCSEIEATEAVLEHVAPWASHAKLVRTGTEALAAAVWLARLWTHRRPVLVAKGSYHGWLPWTTQRGEAETDGEHTFEYSYGAQLDEWEPLTDTPPAAIIVEPARWEETPPGYLQWLQDAAHRMGALFIVDEMIYGGRWAIGGATELDQLQPDLACFGKALGNGAPVAILAGNHVLRDLGERVSGTYSGDVGAARSVAQTLGVYTAHPVIETLWARGRQLVDGLSDAVCSTGWTGRAFVEGVAPVHSRLRFADPTLGRLFSAKMAARGVLWHPDCVNVCCAHTVDQISAVCEAAGRSLLDMADEGLIS